MIRESLPVYQSLAWLRTHELRALGPGV